MAIRALFFDLDDTLLETHTHSSAALNVTCEATVALHPQLTAAGVREVFTPTFVGVEEEMERHEIVFPDGDALWTEVWRRTLRNLGVSDEHGERLCRRYRDERRDRYLLFPDVEEQVPKLVGRYHLQLVTNGLSDIQRGKIAAARLERWFSHVTISSEAGGWKPDPVVFQWALDQAGVPPEETVMIGDNPEKDIAGGRAMGMRTVWMQRWEWQSDRGVTADAVATDMPSLLEILAGWESE